MFSGQTVFSRLMEYFPRHEFNARVRRYWGDSRLRGISCRCQGNRAFNPLSDKPLRNVGRRCRKKAPLKPANY